MIITIQAIHPILHCTHNDPKVEKVRVIFFENGKAHSPKTHLILKYKYVYRNNNSSSTAAVTAAVATETAAAVAEAAVKHSKPPGNIKLLFTLL